MPNVLVVDDERDLVSLLDFNLRQAGFETTLAYAGEEALAVLEPPAFFGEMALIDLSARAASAIANEPSELFYLPLQELRSLIEAQHQIALKVLFALCEVLAQRLRETNERYMSIFTIAQWGGANPSGPLPVP